MVVSEGMHFLVKKVVSLGEMWNFQDNFQGITCSNKKEVCVPQLVDCMDIPCRAVPNCVVNACPQGLPVIDEATFEPLSCNIDAQCASLGTPSFCHNFQNSGGYCCWGTGRVLFIILT